MRRCCDWPRMHCPWAPAAGGGRACPCNLKNSCMQITAALRPCTRRSISELHCCPCQPCALHGSDKGTVRLVGGNAELVFPEAISSKNRIPVWDAPQRCLLLQLPDRLCHRKS